MEQFKAFMRSNSPITDADFELLEPLVLSFNIKKHENLLRQGEICKHVYFLKKGFFRMFYIGLDGNEINCRFSECNRFFVDFDSFLTRSPSRYYWQAMQDSEVFALKYADINALYEKSHSWEKFGRLIAENAFRLANERIEILHFLSPEERYQYILKKSPQLFNQVSLFHIASYLGVKPESLSRLRKRLLKR